MGGRQSKQALHPTSTSQGRGRTAHVGLHADKTQLLPVFRPADCWLEYLCLTLLLFLPHALGVLQKLLGLDSNHKGINCLLAAKTSARQHKSHTSAPITLPGCFVNCAGAFCTVLWSDHNETLCWGAVSGKTDLSSRADIKAEALSKAECARPRNGRTPVSAGELKSLGTGMACLSPCRV